MHDRRRNCTAHDGIVSELLRAHREAGLRSCAEVVVPALSKPSMQEARVDVEAWGTVCLPHAYLDFTLVSPWAQRYAAAAGREPAAAARSAELAKHGKYAEVGGIGVTGLAMEAGGRHGPGLASHLRLLAALARRRGHDRWQL